MTKYVLDVGEAEVIDEAEVADGPIIAEDEGILEEDLLDEGEDKGTGAKDVDIHAYSPEAQIIAGKVAEVHVSVRVSTIFHGTQFIKHLINEPFRLIKKQLTSTHFT